MVKVIRQIDEMRAVAGQWNELAKRFNSPLLQYEWVTACAETLLQSDQLCVVVNHSDNRLQAAAPLVLTKHDGPERLEIVGARALGEPTGFIYENEQSLQELLAGVLEIGKPLLLTKLAENAPEVRMLEQQHGGQSYLRTDSGSPFIDFRGSWDEFFASLRSENRNHLRRKRKALDQAGSVAIEVLSPGLREVGALLEEAIRVEATGWKGKQQTAMACDLQIRNFYETYTREASRLGLLRFSFLRVDGRAIAVQISVCHGNRLWLLKVAYDDEWAKSSPGVLLTHETIRYACEQGLEGFEFLGHDEQWIHRWTRLVHPSITFRGYPLSFSGLGTLAFDACSSILR